MRALAILFASCAVGCASSSAPAPSAPASSTVRAAGTRPPEANEVEVIRSGVRSRYEGVRTCYERGLAHAPIMRGRIVVRFVIARDGSVSSADDAGSTLPDANVIACVLDVFRALTFPKPTGQPVMIVYPMQFEPDEVDR